jgi:hypothetical protein
MRRSTPVWWWLVPLVAVLLVVAASIGWGPWQAYRDRQRLRALANLVKTDAPGPDVVAYEDNVTRAAQIGRRQGYIEFVGWDGRPRVGRAPAAWFDLRMQSPSGWQIAPDDPILFLHARKTSTGTERVVLIHAKPKWPDQRTTVELWAMTLIVSPETGNLPTVVLDQYSHSILVDDNHDDGAGLRVFAGQADRSDASRFTIGYEVDGRTGVIEGWLRDGQDVVLRIRGADPAINRQ